jgi:polyphosphate kinase
MHHAQKSPEKDANATLTLTQPFFLKMVLGQAGGKDLLFISSADWMVRNLDHRVEAACPILDEQIKQEILTILKIQLSDNVKSRILDVNYNNIYVSSQGKKKIRSQQETYNYLFKKQLQLNSETSSN